MPMMEAAVWLKVAFARLGRRRAGWRDLSLAEEETTTSTAKPETTTAARARAACVLVPCADRCRFFFAGIFVITHTQLLRGSLARNHGGCGGIVRDRCNAEGPLQPLQPLQRNLGYMSLHALIP